MRPQTREQAQALAESVLTECKAPQKAAAEIARATYTTPLVTVLAAQLVARDDVSLALLGNEEEFCTYVLRSLQDVITVALVAGQDVPRLRAILRLIALLQPIIPDDPGLLKILLQTEGIEHPDVSRLMRLLGEAGVLFKRGLRWRLAPDLLSDEIIRSNYLNADGTTNERVAQVFDLAGAEHLKNLFVNLGRLDWRLREGKTDDSALLARLVPKLRWGERHNNPHVEAVAAVAYYQPRFALDFAKRLIAEGHGNNSSVCNMLRYAAYTYDHLQEACKLLWIAGRDDARSLNQHPSHGIRILKELAEFQLNKPKEYVREVVRFALALLDRPSSLKSIYTPFSILEGALCTEMQSTSSSRLSMTITRHQLPLEWVRDVRGEVTGALLTYLRESNPQLAFLSAQTMAQALRGPMHGDTSDQFWKQEQLFLLQKIRVIVNEVYVSPVVLVQLAQSVSWHAFYGYPETSVEAKTIIEMLERDLRTRLTRALVDGWGTVTWKLSEVLEREEHILDRQRLTTDLIAAFPVPSLFFDELQASLGDLLNVAHDDYGSSFLLMNHLISSVPGLATELLLRNDAGSIGRLDQYVGAALSAVVNAGDANLVNEYVIRANGSAKVLAQLAEAYARFETFRPYTPQEIELFKRIFKSKDATVLMIAASLTRQVASRSPALAIELICLADFEVTTRATHDMFMWLSGDNAISEVDLVCRRKELLGKLIVVKELRDYWVRAFLTASLKKDPTSVVGLVMARLAERERRDDWSYEPLRKEYNGEGLGLMKVEIGPRLLKDFLDFALERLNNMPSALYVGEAVAGLCGEYDQATLEVLLDWMSSGTALHAKLIARVLRESQPSLIYDHSKFVRDIVTAAELISEEAMEDIRSAIASATTSGVRGGTPYEPFPEDLKMEKHCKEMMSTLSRVEPIFDLYEELLRNAQYAISRQRKSKESLEDEDE